MAHTCSLVFEFPEKELNFIACRCNINRDYTNASIFHRHERIEIH
jgi:hypothetical protein